MNLERGNVSGVRGARSPSVLRDATVRVLSREGGAPAGSAKGDCVVPVLLEVSLDDGGGSLLVEVDRADLPGGLVLASPKPGEAAAKAARTLAESLERLEPVLRTVKDRLAASAPEAFEVKFGVKLAGETGIILAKGTAEVNFEITMKWGGRDPEA
jgi:hypothetical protein